MIWRSVAATGADKALAPAGISAMKRTGGKMRTTRKAAVSAAMESAAATMESAAATMESAAATMESAATTMESAPVALGKHRYANQARCCKPADQTNQAC
jgi:hypothetical protein